MKKMFVVYALLTLVYTINTDAQTRNSDNIQRYIERYRSLAMSEQQRTGIPAAIKLAQAIHESGAGSSPLAVQANNHFGLKCKSDWTGATFLHTDDRRNECFRKYNMDFESYQDQSNYLKANPRYAALFQLSVTDYAAWAFGLRKAGYATNPQYPQLLIKLIEDYHLQEYTYAAMGNTGLVDNSVAANNNNERRNSRSQQQYQQPAENNYSRNNYSNNNNSYNNNYGNAQPAAQSYGYNQPASPGMATTTYDNSQPERTSKYIDTRPRDRHTVTRSRQNGREVETRVDDAPSTVVKINNLKAVYGKKGDMPLQYAVRNGIRYEKFLEINDLKEEPLPADMPLYLERKHFWGIRPMHLVKYGEVMIEIAQKEGIQLKYLRDLNYMEEDEEPVPGVTLELQAQAAGKPNVMKREESPVYAQLSGSDQEQYQGEPDEAYPGNQQPVSTFPKNPAPIHTEEKNIFEKIKEKREERRLEKEREEAAKKQHQPVTQQQPAQQQQSQPSKYIQRTPAQQQTQYVQRTPAQQPAEQAQSKYLQEEEPVQQQPVAQQQQYQQTQSYSRQQYSYSNNTTNIKPNPAAQQPVEEKSARELRKEERRKKKEEEQPVATQPAPQPQKPQTELDKLKAQFDNVVYADNNSNRGRQTTQSYQQPQQQQNNYQQQRTQQYQQNNYNRQQQYQQPAQQQYQQPAQQQYQQNNYQAQQQYQQPAYQQQGQQYQAQQQQNYDPSKYYLVKRGDTAYTIAKKHGITIRQLMEWNGLDFDAIKEGQNLRVKQ